MFYYFLYFFILLLGIISCLIFLLEIGFICLVVILFNGIRINECFFILGCGIDKLFCLII